MNNLPIGISILFCLTTLLTLGLFYKATHFSKITLLILVAWLVLQSIPGISGFYTITNNVPPRFILLIGPPLLFIITLFLTPKGKNYIDGLSIKTLTLLHIIRIPVELVLFWLFTYKTVPQLMTFEGRNFDILSGLTAPLIYYFGFVKKKIGKVGLLLWNFACLALLINIVVNAVLSAPFPFQKFAYEQPNIALFYFPFVWLPCCIVPIVLFAQLVTIRQLLNGRGMNVTVPSIKNER